MGPDEIYPRVLRELVEVLTEPFSAIYWQSWLAREAPIGWKSGNVMPIYKNGWKENPGSYRHARLTSVLRNIVE